MSDETKKPEKKVAPTKAKAKSTKTSGNGSYEKRDRLFLVIIVAVVVIAIACIAFFTLNKKDNDVKDPNDNNQQQTQDPNQQPNNENNNSTDLSNTENVTVTNEGEKINNSEELAKEKTFDGMIIRDISLSAKGGLTSFFATVVNESGKDQTARPIQVIFTNNAGEESVLEAYLSDVKAGGTTYIDASTTEDLSNAHDFKIVEKQ